MTTLSIGSAYTRHTLDIMTINAYAECHYAHYQHLVYYAECRYAERRYGECRGAKL